MSVTVRPIAQADVPAAALIHAEGQPGTFLTALGGAFLRSLYAEMVGSPLCYGFVAELDGAVVGVVVGSTDSGAVFKELMLRRGLKLAFPVFGAIIRQPSLIGKVWQTLFYPSQIEVKPDESELFFIGTTNRSRGQGVGKALFLALADESRRRGMKAMGLTVDDDNDGAKQFYQRNGMAPGHTFTLYGRKMNWYVLPLEETPPLPAS